MWHFNYEANTKKLQEMKRKRELISTREKERKKVKKRTEFTAETSDGIVNSIAQFKNMSYMVDYIQGKVCSVVNIRTKYLVSRCLRLMFHKS